jgi:hypothetical protein
MLTKMKLFALCAALAGGVGIAAAQPAPAPGSQPQQTQRSEKWAAKKAEMLAKYDTNKDGKLDANERAVMKDEKATERFQKMDTNKDGQVSLDEFKAFAKTKHGHHARGGKGHRRGMRGIGGNGALGGGGTQ